MPIEGDIWSWGKGDTPLSPNETNPEENVSVVAPASTANLGPGFDVFGMALDLFHDKVTIDPISNRGIEIQSMADGYVAKPSNVATLVGDNT